MAAMQPGMNLYGELPDSYNLVVNTASPLVDSVRQGSSRRTPPPTVEPLLADIAKGNADAEAARKAMQESTRSRRLSRPQRVALRRRRSRRRRTRALEAAVDA